MYYSKILKNPDETPAPSQRLEHGLGRRNNLEPTNRAKIGSQITTALEFVDGQDYLRNTTQTGYLGIL